MRMCLLIPDSRHPELKNINDKLGNTVLFLAILEYMYRIPYCNSVLLYLVFAYVSG